MDADRSEASALSARFEHSYGIFQIARISPISPDLIEQAINRLVLSQVSFLDVLIVAVSFSGGCTTIYSRAMRSASAPSRFARADRARQNRRFIYRSAAITALSKTSAPCTTSAALVNSFGE